MEPGKVERDEGGARWRAIGDPRLPSQQEVEEHYLTHVPYRNWCPHCVRGRGKDLDHRRSTDDDRRVREFSFDYCFPGDEKGTKITVLVGKERITGMTMACVVPMKGTSGQFAAMRVLEFIKECGAAETEILLKTDQEPAIDALMDDVVKTRGEKITLREKSPVGSSGSNGVVERGVQFVEGVIRTLLSALEERIGVKIKAEEKIVIFLAEYAAYLLNKREVGKDGKTAYERNKGKKGEVLAVEFGEKLLWKVRPKNKMEKLNARWEYGVFVGVKGVSGEIWVATKEGVRAVRSVRRIAAEERWKPENKDWVKHVPWNKEGGDPEADGEIPDDPEEHRPSGGREDEAASSGGQRVIVVNTREAAPRDFYIKLKDLEKHGHTRECPGCRTMIKGGSRQAHTAECRERFRGLMKDEEKVRRTHEKRKGFEERMNAKEQRNEEKRKGKEERREERGQKRRAEDDGIEEERIREAAPEEKEEEGRGQKRRAEEDGIEDERIREAAPEEEKGQQMMAEGGEMEQERLREAVAASSEDMAIEAVFGGGAGQEEQAWDDVRGGELDREEVRNARMEEVQYMKAKGLWEVVPRSRAEASRVVSVKWVDTNKGTDEKPLIRCRLVARDFRVADKDREDLFAATPPWELKKLLMSQAANRGEGKARKMLLIDVKKAHLNPECKEEVHVELPREAGAGPNQIGKLKHWLYGFRPTAAAWENHYAEKLQSEGFSRGLATPVSFYHEANDVSLVVHGDDFTFVGEDRELDWVEGLMKRWYEVKVRARLGPDETDDKEATLLGRVVRWNSWGISCEADPKHRKLVLEALGLEEDSKSLVMPGTKEDDKVAAQDEAEAKGPGENTKFRAIAARLNYMASDMPDIQFSCKEACRDMASPTSQSWAKIKRIGRYLVGRSRVVWRFPWKDGVGDWKVYTDSDWAGDLKTRRSTSGGMIMLGPHCLKTWSATQGAPALSSCEAEYYAAVEGATRALGMQTAAKEWGISAGDLVIEAATDSSGAKSFASRRGSGRVRHIETKWLWLQHAVATGRFRMQKILGVNNPADVFTKFLTLSDMKAKLGFVNVEIEGKAQGPGAQGGGRGVQRVDAGLDGGARSRSRPRLVWADAFDSDCEAAVGTCDFCGHWADDCWRSHPRGGVKTEAHGSLQTEVPGRQDAAILAKALQSAV